MVEALADPPPASHERKHVIDGMFPRSAVPQAFPAFAVIMVYAAARLLDPAYADVPLFGSQDRIYYLFALLMLATVIVLIAAARQLTRRNLLADVGAGTLVIGAATLLFVGHQGLALALAIVVLALAERYFHLRSVGTAGTPGVIQVNRVITGVLLWIFLFGVLEFHLRWAFSLPLAFIAGSAAAARLEPRNTYNRASRLALPFIGGLAAAQLVMATSFLDARPVAGATFIVISLAAIYGVFVMSSNDGTA